MAGVLRRILFALAFVVAFSSCKKNFSNDGDRLPLVENDIVETQPPVQQAVTKRVNSSIGGYYSALPAMYNKTTKSYPLLVFLPGGGQFGNGVLDLPFLLNDGVAQIIDEKRFPANFAVKGKNYSFIVLTPQFSGYPPNNDVASFVEYAKKTYRVDASRIYMAGLSIGGFVTTDFGAANASMLAAIVPIAGANTIDGEGKCEKIARQNLAVWSFHNANDPQISSSTSENFVAFIKKYNPGVIPKLTLFPASVHDAWTKAIDPAFKEDNMNIYEWMLQYSR